MNQLKQRLTSIALVALSAIAPLTLEFKPTQAQAQEVDSIPLYVPPPERQTNGVCDTFLEPTIDGIINTSPVANGQWGILVESIDGKVLYSHNANVQLIPASNVKLLTTAAALQRLNPQTSIRSQSLRQWVLVTNQRSDNNYANVLLSYIGGPGAARQILTQMGISPAGFRQVDGSGLSRQNRATPSVLVTILKAMRNANNSDIWYESLPVSGSTGTLRNRLRNSPAQGIVRAKTGTLRGVRALSGYVENPYYGTLVFSILANHPSQNGTLVTAIDNIAVQLAQVIPCN
ncbi:MAG: D-alanyl-D-alanine carboxypeptidase [Jaaginema sp. PMC 1079.18]|nr:D-alanyl-D-alanine carboxypeptidase [Jaaginema sp. PMC 1080.18]MEC4849506.1 D-alanyl-D-alanine carboxypeptidase [Jaaginema sp. PMC 1079.18]MEC4865615.1 D-alanyl-D-alanine carboxypeptidase [Jaaginema sp. PMC 1078.18]